MIAFNDLQITSFDKIFVLYHVLACYVMPHFQFKMAIEITKDQIYDGAISNINFVFMVLWKST